LQRLAAHLDAQATAACEAIPQAGRDAPLPLSFAQQRLWFIDRLEGGSAQYNMPLLLRLRGELDVPALQQALDTLVARHEILRTVYSDTDGAALQQIQPARAVAMACDDLRRLPAAAGAQRLQQLAADEAAQPFDLAQDLMLRCRLVHSGEHDYALLLTLHHIACDGWSLDVLVREFVALYGALRQGRPAQLAPLPVQYADYAAWQRRRLHGEALQAQLGYWRTQLAGLPALHSLPLDRPRPAQQRFDGARVEQLLDAPTLAALQALARQHDASLFMLLQAAFAVLVSRWSGATDIVLGTPSAGRLHADVEPLIGFFVNTLVLRTDLSGDPTFASVLQQTRAAALSAYEHQEVPFEMLVDELKPTRSLAHAPLFQLMFALQNNALAALELPDLSVTAAAGAQERAKFDLQLDVAETELGLSLSWTYAQSLFDAASIERMADAFQRLLRGIVEAPQQAISRLPLLSPREREQVLLGFNATQQAPSGAQTIASLFEAQVARAGTAPALRSEEETYTYAELNQRANRLAHALLAQGVKPDQRVAICVQRGLDLVVGLLGILKAGAAYVPLDPAYPADRLAYMLADCAPVALLTQGRLA
ncbi:condensation domain-containing protein, partial [Tahibacter aquaticus]|uniref:condensation domain-containing protein n=1 Tax=Tahibacter aquaticus TaxID=520092 RepID=UPI001414D87E